MLLDQKFPRGAPGSGQRELRHRCGVFILYSHIIKVMILLSSITLPPRR